MCERFWLQCAICLTTFALACLPSLAKDKIKWRPGIHHYVQIPILYMTDRFFYKDRFLNQRKLENGSIYEMYCGTLEYIIENVKQKTLTEEQKKLGWQYVDKLPKNPLQLHPDSESGKKFVYAQFGERVIETAKKSGCVMD